MKTYTKLLSGIFLLALAFALQSCSKCKDVECQNSGDCKKGDCECTAPYFGTLCEYECKNGGTISGNACNCATGYEGTECETEQREKFYGIFEGNESCTQTGSGSLTITISTSATIITEVQITGSWSTFLNPIIATVSGNNFTIASQDPDNNGKTISGSGSITNDQTKISVDYTITDAGVNVCSATLTRQ